MWGGCSIKGSTTKELLIASHINPWSESSNDDRLNPYNGLLLIANLDKALDSGLISFKTTGEIMISPLFKDFRLAAVDEKMKLKLKPKHQPFLDYHRQHVYTTS